jgi:hypothetical protein
MLWVKKPLWLVSIGCSTIPSSCDLISLVKRTSLKADDNALSPLFVCFFSYFHYGIWITQCKALGWHFEPYYRGGSESEAGFHWIEVTRKEFGLDSRNMRSHGTISHKTNLLLIDRYLSWDRERYTCTRIVRPRRSNHFSNCRSFSLSILQSRIMSDFVGGGMVGFGTDWSHPDGSTRSLYPFVCQITNRNTKRPMESWLIWGRIKPLSLPHVKRKCFHITTHKGIEFDLESGYWPHYINDDQENRATRGGLTDIYSPHCTQRREGHFWCSSGSYLQGPTTVANYPPNVRLFIRMSVSSISYIRKNSLIVKSLL